MTKVNDFASIGRPPFKTRQFALISQLHLLQLTGDPQCKHPHCGEYRTCGPVGQDGPDKEGGHAGCSRGQGGSHSAVGDGKGVLEAHQHQLGAWVESVPAQQEKFPFRKLLSLIYRPWTSQDHYRMCNDKLSWSSAGRSAALTSTGEIKRREATGMIAAHG